MALDDVTIAQKLTETEQRSKSNTHRIEGLEKRQDELDKIVTSVAVLAEKQGVVETDVKEIKSDVKALAEKPSKRWDGLVDRIILTVAAAAIGFVLARLGIV